MYVTSLTTYCTATSVWASMDVFIDFQIAMYPTLLYTIPMIFRQGALGDAKNAHQIATCTLREL